MPSTPCRPIVVGLIGCAAALSAVSLIVLFTPGGPLLHGFEAMSVGMLIGAAVVLLSQP